PDALAGLRRINQLRFISIPDQHRRQIRPAKVGPDRQEIDIVKTDVINAVAQQLEPDVLDEAAIERKPERLLHNGQRHRDVLVDLIPREVGRHMRKKLCQMLRAIPIGYDNSQAWRRGRQWRLSARFLKAKYEAKYGIR